MRRIGIIGHKGVCGIELLKLLNRDVQTYDRGQKIVYLNLDILFCCVDSESTKDIVKKNNNPDLFIIDMSSAFRTNTSLPLILPTVNSHLINNSLKLISLPNCVVSILLTALHPLHKKASIRKLLLTTFQAASGAGKNGLLALKSNKTIAPFPYPLKDNLFLHESRSDHPTLCGEEEKIIFETRKVLQNNSLQINTRCVRLAVKRAHSIHAVVSFEQNIHNVEEILNSSCHLRLHPSANPSIAEGKRQVFISNIRKVEFEKNTYDFWIVGDQLLRGAALNAYEVFCKILENHSLEAICK